MPKSSRIALGALAAPTIIVVWAGLALPPPHWVFLPGGFGAPEVTGRVAVVEGMEFHEFAAGCLRTGHYDLPKTGDLDVRVAAAFGIRGNDVLLLTFDSALHEAHRIPPPGWRRQGPFWLGRHTVVLPGHTRPEAERLCDEAAAKTGLPLRLPTYFELEAIRFAEEFPQPTKPVRGSLPKVDEWCVDADPVYPWVAGNRLVIELPTSWHHRRAFSLGPGEERLVAPYLVGRD